MKKNILIVCLSVLCLVLYWSCFEFDTDKTDSFDKEIKNKSTDSSVMELAILHRGELNYRFDIESLSLKLRDAVLSELNEDVVLEDIVIEDSLPQNPNWRAEAKVSVYNITKELGTTAWFYIEKQQTTTGDVVYFVKDGDNQPNFFCEQHNCKGNCIRRANYDERGNMTAAWCECTNDPDTRHFCKQASLQTSQNSNIFSVIWDVLKKIW